MIKVTNYAVGTSEATRFANLLCSATGRPGPRSSRRGRGGPRRPAWSGCRRADHGPYVGDPGRAWFCELLGSIPSSLNAEGDEKLQKSLKIFLGILT